jgi:phosphoserine/homoserine phosphotransferase
MHIVCLDLEGVLVPEIWIAVSKKTGIDELKLTTRDIPDYDVLMKKRIGILKEHNLKLKDIQDVISTLEPLDGGLEFLEELRVLTQVIILSDTFVQFAKPLMKKLRWPTLFCNSLVIDEKGMIADYRLRQKEGKKKAVESLKSLGFDIFSAGDSYNDLLMLKASKLGVLFCPPDSIIKENPQLPVARDYKTLFALFQKEIHCE